MVQVITLFQGPLFKNYDGHAFLRQCCLRLIRPLLGFGSGAIEVPARTVILATVYGSSNCMNNTKTQNKY